MAITGLFGEIDSSMVTAAAIAYATGVARLAPEETPLLSMVSPGLMNLDVIPHGVGSPDGTAGGATSIKYAEKMYRVGRTTFNGAVTSVATSATLTDKVAEIGFLIQSGEEVMSLDSSADGLTFNIGRSVGAGAAEAHADGAEVLILGKPFEEGADAKTGGLVVEPSEVTNYLEIFQEVADVTGSQRFLAQYYQGNSDKLLAYTAEHIMALKHQLEHRLIWGVAQARSGKTTAGRMDGIYERVASSYATDMSNDVITYNDIQATVRAMRKFGARPNVFLCSYYQADYFNNLGLSHVIVDGSEAARMIYGSVVPALRVGDLVIDIIATDKMDLNACLLTTSNIKVGPKEKGRAFHVEPLGKTGDSDQLMVVGEYTNQVKLPRSHHWFGNVKNA